MSFNKKISRASFLRGAGFLTASMILEPVHSIYNMGAFWKQPTMSSSGWSIIMASTGNKTSNNTPASSSNVIWGYPGSTNWPGISSSSTGASGRNTFGAGWGLYDAFFTKKNITKFAIVDGSSTSLNPSSHSNYCVYDLVSSLGNESTFELIKRLDTYLQNNAGIHANDTVFNSASATNFTAGTNGYSGILSASGGSSFKTSTNGTSGATNVVPNKFCIWGINYDSDNDSQVLCAYAGNLASGKGDAWRGQNPTDTFWSYWGGDFHSNSQTQRIGAAYYQTSPGISDTVGSGYTGAVYLLAYSP